MKKLVVIALSICTLTTMAGIDVEKKGGKKCGNSVCYDYVSDKITDNGDRKIRCRDKGPNSCPTYGVVTVGGTSFQLNDILDYVENQINAGVGIGSYELVANGIVVGVCTWEGSVNSEGIVEYNAHIE
jgi:hypothetical protein